METEEVTVNCDDASTNARKPLRIGRYAWFLLGAWATFVAAFLAWSLHDQYRETLEVARLARASAVTLMVRCCLLWLIGTAGILLTLRHLGNRIRKQHHMQNALLRSETKYRTLYESSRDAITLVSCEEGILGGNSAALNLFGCKDEQEFVSFTPADLSPEHQPDGMLSTVKSQEMIALAMKNGSHLFEWTHKRIDGREFLATVLITKMELTGQTLLQATVRDITEHKRVEQQIQDYAVAIESNNLVLEQFNEATEAANQQLQAEIAKRKRKEQELVQVQKLEAIGQLAAGIAHEINTPTQYVGDNTRFLDEAFGDLAKMLGKFDQLLQAAKDGTLTDDLVAEVEATVRQTDLDYLAEEIPRAIEQSLEGVNRVATIVRAMKEFSHPGSDSKRAIDLNRAIENTLTVSRNEWKYIAELVTDFDRSLPLVPCLSNELNQAVLNLVVNAAHAIAGVVGDGSESKGTITVRTRRNGDWAEIRIEDTGTGIPEDIREKVFDHFFTTKDVGKGTGQGLTIAYSTVVEKHGGTIAFETEVGRGTTFIIRLPITEPDGIVQLEPMEAAL